MQLRNLVITALTALLGAFATSPAYADGSNITFFADKNIRVIVDGKIHGHFKKKQVVVSNLSPGNHQIGCYWFNPKFMKRKEYYSGTYNVPANSSLRIQCTQGSLVLLDKATHAPPTTTTKKTNNTTTSSSVKTTVRTEAAPAPTGKVTFATKRVDFGSGPSLLHINAEKMISLVIVDGAPLDHTNCNTKRCTVDVPRGSHELDVRYGLGMKKKLFEGIVNVPGGAEVFAKVSGGNMSVYNIQKRVYPVVAEVEPEPVVEPVQQQPTIVVVRERTSSYRGPSYIRSAMDQLDEAIYAADEDRHRACRRDVYTGLLDAHEDLSEIQRASRRSVERVFEDLLILEEDAEELCSRGVARYLGAAIDELDSYLATGRHRRGNSGTVVVEHRQRAEHPCWNRQDSGCMKTRNGYYCADARTINQLVATVKAEPNEYSKLEIVKAASRGHYFTTMQVGMVIDGFRNELIKVDAVEIMAPRVVDPENGWAIKQRFRNSLVGDDAVELMTAQASR